MPRNMREQKLINIGGGFTGETAKNNKKMNIINVNDKEVNEYSYDESMTSSKSSISLLHNSLV